MFSKMRILTFLKGRQFSTKVKVKVNEAVNELFEKEVLKPRKHPGVCNPGVVKLPENIYKAMKIVLQDQQVKLLQEPSKDLYNHLHGRQPPCEEQVYKEKYKEIQEKVMSEVEWDTLSPECQEKVHKANEKVVLKFLKQRIHGWKPVNYDESNSILYMLARGMPDYAVLYKIFYEIKLRDQNFSPQAIFDFGSGLGTALWAAKTLWEKPMKEYYGVEISKQMIDLSDKILKSAFPGTKNVYYRQYFPLSMKAYYDIVISAFSLFELPDAKERVNVLYKLWNKTNKYLVIVEHGTPAGFNIISEAREFLNYVSQNKEKPDFDVQIFSPCTHQLQCPVAALENQKLCNFQTIHETLPFFDKITRKSEQYCYVVFRKGKRFDENWPRIVKPILTPSKQAICRMCLKSGKLQEVIFTKHVHGKYMYRAAKKSNWGDRLPIEIDQMEAQKSTETQKSMETYNLAEIWGSQENENRDTTQPQSKQPIEE